MVIRTKLKEALKFWEESQIYLKKLLGGEVRSILAYFRNRKDEGRAFGLLRMHPDIAAHV